MIENGLYYNNELKEHLEMLSEERGLYLKPIKLIRNLDSQKEFLHVNSRFKITEKDFDNKSELVRLKFFYESNSFSAIGYIWISAFYEQCDFATERPITKYEMEDMKKFLSEALRIGDEFG